VGAGPSGLILSLLLSKKGISVELLDAGAELDKQPRAAHYASAATYELERAGVLDDLKERGFSPEGFAFRKFDTSFIAGINHASLPEDYPYKMQVLPLDQLGQLLYEHIQRQPKAAVKWSHRVVKIGQDQSKAWVDVETTSGTHRSQADFVIGCDGASSTVRRELFGPEYPGETLNAQIIATNVHLPAYHPLYPIPSPNKEPKTNSAPSTAGILRLRPLQLLGCKLHSPPNKILHGRPHNERRPLPSDIRGYTGSQ
jgi:2-polyprenyl-6-methoxyphenol hydroxylase-like FAD-dependent oxidoreductase